MQVKLVKIELIALCENTLLFWHARAKFLLAHTLCWSPVDLRGRMTDGETISYHR